MPNPPDPTPPADPAPPADPDVENKDQITLSSQELQDTIKAAVEQATVSLATTITELKTKFDDVATDIKVISDERGVALLAEVNAMEEDIKKEDESFDSKMLYAEDANPSVKKDKLEIYIKGINKGAQLSKRPPTITLADPEKVKTEEDAMCVAMYGKTYDEMLASPPEAGGAE